MAKIYSLLIGGCCLIVILVILFIYLFSASTVNINVDGISRTIDIRGKSFETICKDSGGLWMTKEMSMGDLKNGLSISIEKCSGCMPDSKNMFCKQNEYLDYITKNGVNTLGRGENTIDKGELR